MTDEQKEGVWRKIHDESLSVLFNTDEKDQLDKLLRTPLMHKVLGHVYAVSKEQQNQLMTLNFSDKEHCHIASAVQGQIRASVGLIQMMMDMTDEEEEDNVN